MSINTNELIQYCDNYLEVFNFSDYCPNGLQVQGKESIKSIVSGVTASQALIDRAIEANADAILVHHGYFWKNENPSITGIKYQRIQKLIKHNINLIAYHLPLDAHPEVGNNALLAKALGIIIDGKFGPNQLALKGTIETTSGEQLNKLLTDTLKRPAMHISATKEIRTIGLCTGAAHNFIDDAILQGVDAYISGEISESIVHIARENNIHYYSAGHHATERFGADALGQHLALKFDLQHQFVDIDNPV
ncbi:MAG: Nif3-like dinuclear metal center hexameric protein [Gammaproteobacteria bacterium]|nr:Nif3-like dinuclear metal center hexameric protein [Gammaproteobacteria bacterium]